MAKVFNFTQPVKPDGTSPCNSEAITFSGNLHIVVAVTNDSNGGFHFKSHTNTQGVRGIGLTTGAKYIVVETSDSEEYSNPSEFPAEITLVSHSKAIAQGTVPDFTLHSIMKFTFNANGDITAFKVDFKSECK